MAEANGILFVTPILVAALSAPLLGERVDWRRWVGVAVGFAGALIIIRPGSGAMHLSALFPLGSACLFALYQIATKELSLTDSTMTTLFYSGVVGALLTSLAVPFFWITPSPSEWFFLVILGVLSGSTHFCLIRAFESAPAATVAPFMYSTLIWATMSGYVFFDDLPDIWTLVGAAIIAGSGIYIAVQERLQREGEE
jgi:drug/metabolite transporter (DMT)-like permease